jgi:hypothetical protein
LSKSTARIEETGGDWEGVGAEGRFCVAEKFRRAPIVQEMETNTTAKRPKNLKVIFVLMVLLGRMSMLKALAATVTFSSKLPLKLSYRCDSPKSL